MTERTNPHGPQEYRGNGNHEWEQVTYTNRIIGDTNVERLRVPGGWLYSTLTRDFELATENESVVFVPVPQVVGYRV